jgi:SAM-dependent methyltransferase
VTSQPIGKEVGRRAFGLDPAGYHRARPQYPAWLYQALCSRGGLTAGTSVVEIGPGTGKATRRLLDLGANPLVAVEPDARLAHFLRTSNPDAALTVVVSSFEDAALDDAGFDLGVSATAFHWLDEDAALAKVARLLRPRGWWAAFWNVFGDDRRPDPFHVATKELLNGLSSLSSGDAGLPFGLDTEARLAALKRTGAFDRIEAEVIPWSLSLDADEAVALYGTFSNVNIRPDRDEVLNELGRIAREEFGGRVVRNMTTSLYMARKAG